MGNFLDERMKKYWGRSEIMSIRYVGGRERKSLLGFMAKFINFTGKRPGKKRGKSEKS
jgi:hypothetical protein